MLSKENNTQKNNVKTRKGKWRSPAHRPQQGFDNPKTKSQNNDTEERNDAFKRKQHAENDAKTSKKNDAHKQGSEKPQEFK